MSKLYLCDYKKIKNVKKIIVFIVHVVVVSGLRLKKNQNINSTNLIKKN